MQESNKGGIISTILILALVGCFAIFTPGCTDNTSDDGDNNSNNESSGGTSRAKVGELAPDFEITTVSGDRLKLSDYIGEKPVVLDFWATWCSPCLRELPVLQIYYVENSDKVEIIAITSEGAGDLAKIERTIAEKGVEYPVIHDSSRDISKMYPTNGIPYLVFIDKDGIVVETHLGLDPNIGAKIDETFGL